MFYSTRYYLPNPSARAGYDTRSIFKRSLTGFNSEFSFSLTSCLTKAEEPSLSYYLPIAGGRIIGFIPFPRVYVKCNQFRPGFELVSPCPFPTTITTTPQGTVIEQSVFDRWHSQVSLVFVCLPTKSGTWPFIMWWVRTSRNSNVRSDTKIPWTNRYSLKKGYLWH